MWLQCLRMRVNDVRLRTAMLHGDVPLMNADLCHHVNPANQDCAFDLDARAQRLELLGYLYGQLPCGGQHEREERLRLVQQLLQYGQSEGTRLAGPRLREADDIAPCTCRTLVVRQTSV
jgi:hypothetical protein